VPKDTGFRLVSADSAFKVFKSEVYQSSDESLQDFMDYVFSVYSEDDMTVHMRPGGYAYIMRFVKVTYGKKPS